MRRGAAGRSDPSTAEAAPPSVAGRVARAAALALVLLVAWRALLGQSVRRDTESLRRAVRDHCRHELGLPSAWRAASHFEAAFEGCDDFEVVSARAAGGLHDPVIVRIELRRGPRFPLEFDAVSLRHALLVLPVVASFTGLASGRWEWNPGVAFSDFRFFASL